MTGVARAGGLLLGFAADRCLGDPRRFHPVAGFGQVAAALERRWYADTRARGAGFTLVLVGGTALLGAAATSRHSRVGEALLTAVATWAVLGGRSLEQEALAVASRLEQHPGDLAPARQRLTHLVGRDTSALDESQIARAVVESIAENTADAVVSPLFWGAVAGVPGLLGYRAANTLDAMVGHRSPRYRNFGWASARFDDLVNLPGARLAALSTLLAAPSRAKAGWRAWRRDAAGHPSPNAGVIEATFAGVLGIRLGGENTYGERVEDRARMGDGRAPQRDDITAATTLARRTDLVAVGLSAVLSGGLSFAAGAVGSRRRDRRRPGAR